jgi:DNA-binding MurR/RpiR family transcriptional regulator
MMPRARSSGTPFSQDFLHRVAETRGTLSTNDARVADHLRDHMGELPFHTAASLAERVSVSRAAVIRLTQRLGYSGFVDVRNRSREELRAAGSPLQRFGPQHDTSPFSRMVARDIANLELTLKLVEKLVPRATTLLSEANNLYVIGNNKSYGAAIYLYHLLQGVRPRVHMIHPWNRRTATEMDDGDVLIACIFLRYSRETVRIMKYASRRHVPVIAITDGGGHPLLRSVAVSLVAQTDSSTLYPSLVAPLALIQLLAAEVAAANPDVARTALSAAESFFDGREFLSR